jgi:hypothetical protein
VPRRGVARHPADDHARRPELPRSVEGPGRGPAARPDPRRAHKYVLHEDELGLSEEFYRIASDPWESLDLRRSGTWTAEEEAIFYALQEEMALLLQS